MARDQWRPRAPDPGGGHRARRLGPATRGVEPKRDSRYSRPLGVCMSRGPAIRHRVSSVSVSSLLSRLRLPPLPPQKRPADLVYAAPDLPPSGALLGLGMQHAATALALIAYVLVAAHMAQLPLAATNSLVTATVLGMALATLLQAWGGRVGAGALIVHIPDPVIIMTAAAILVHYGPGGLVAAGLVNGLVGFFVAQVLPRLRALFPPTVAGVVVCLTGLSLVTPALEHSTGMGDGGPLDLHAVLITTVALAVVVGMSVWGTRRMKLFALLSGLLAGVVVAALFGRLSGGELLAAAPLFALPALPVPVLNVDLGLLLAVALLSLMVQLDTLGTVILMNKMDDADWRRADMRRVGRGIRAGSISAIAGGFLGGLPSSTSSANIALCHISRSTSRYVGIAAAALLALVAFMPKGTLALTLIPTPVIGAVEIYAAAYLIVSGVELIASRAMDSRAIFMVGLSVVAGMGVILLPALPRHAPEVLQFVVSNGVILGGIIAILLNMIFRLGTSRRAARAIDPLPESTADYPYPPPDAATAIVQFVEHQGGVWGARRDIVHRAAAAALEGVEAIGQADGRRLLQVRGTFDEFNLDIELLHSGPPLPLAGAPADTAHLLDTDDANFHAALDAALAGVSTALLKRLTDRVTTGERNGQAYLRLHFDH